MEHSEWGSALEVLTLRSRGLYMKLAMVEIVLEVAIEHEEAIELVAVNGHEEASGLVVVSGVFVHQWCLVQLVDGQHGCEGKRGARCL